MAINPDDITTIRVGQLTHALPTLTDKIPHEIGTDLFHCTIQELVDLFNINANAFQYEVKTLYVDQTYIDTNLDSTGLGINLLVGWAEINGNNGTPPASGMFELSRKAIDYPIGSFGGAKEITLTTDQIPSHAHGMTYANTSGGTKYPETPYIGDTVGGAMQGTGVEGGGQPHNNMPPYYVCLKIMKL